MIFSDCSNRAGRRVVPLGMEQPARLFSESAVWGALSQDFFIDLQRLFVVGARRCVVPLILEHCGQIIQRTCGVAMALARIFLLIFSDCS